MYPQVTQHFGFRRCVAVPVDFAKIERLRVRAALTQAEIGQRVGLSKQGWNNMVKGRRPNLSVQTLERIADVLGVAIAELIKPR